MNGIPEYERVIDMYNIIVENFEHELKEVEDELKEKRYIRKGGYYATGYSNKSKALHSFYEAQLEKYKQYINYLSYYFNKCINNINELVFSEEKCDVLLQLISNIVEFNIDDKILNKDCKFLKNKKINFIDVYTTNLKGFSKSVYNLSKCKKPTSS